MKKTYLKPKMEFHQIGMTHYLIGMSDTPADSTKPTYSKEHMAIIEEAEAGEVEDLW